LMQRFHLFRRGPFRDAYEYMRHFIFGVPGIERLMRGVVREIVVDLAVGHLNLAVYFPLA